MANLRRFLVEVFIFAACLFIGAAIFQALEYRGDDSASSERQSNKIVETVAFGIREKYNISAQQMNKTIQKLRRKLVRAENEKWENWDFTGCYFFAGTVAFTIGFGHQAPKTSLGQLMVIIYALIAIPITGLMLSACGERMAEHQQKVVVFIERRIFKREPTHLQAKAIAMNVFVLICFFIIGSCLTKYYYDGWSIVEGLYFMWICMTTVGFGDYIINDGKPYYEGNLVKTMMLRFNVIFLIIGLCQVSCLLVSIQNALETKFVKKVSEKESGDGSGRIHDDGRNPDNEMNGIQTNKEELGRNNDACDLETVESKIPEVLTTTCQRI